MTFITCMSKLEKTDLGWPEFGTTRVFGFKKTWEEAIESLHNNTCDMYEYLYIYAVIEEMEPAIHPDVIRRQFFKWDNEKEGFFEIEEPDFMKHFCNIALG